MRKLRWVALALSVMALCAALPAWHYVRDNRMPNFGRMAEIYVYPGTSSSEAMSMIADGAGVIDMRSMERAFRSKEVDRYIKPGHYTVSPSSSSVYVARMLNNGWQTPVKVTLAGNLRLKGNISAKISSQLLVDSASVRAALDDGELLARYGFNPANVFSLLMPATYEMYWTASMEDFLDRQKEAYDAFWTEENMAKAAALGLDRTEVSILASIVNGETNNEPEMPKIAGVYLNRLSIGMPLQADPTVAFCFDYAPGRILRKHLEVDSPYNTYRHSGLPPGPICVPTKAALLAVLNPDFGGPGIGKGNLYFCANPDFSGTHVFARTLDEHNRNAAAFRRELDRRAAARRKG